MDLAYRGCFGAEIIAPVSGRVSQGWEGVGNSGGGNWSALVGQNGDYRGFGHASKFAWPEGGVHDVEAGQVIAFVGSTGAATGAHLHIAYQPRNAGSYQDPFDVLVARASTQGRGRSHPHRPDTGDEIDMASIEELQTEFANQGARTRAYIDQVIAAKDTRDRMFMTALIAKATKATKAIGGDDAVARLKSDLRRGRG